MKLEFIALIFCTVVVLVTAADKNMLKFEGENINDLNDLLKKMSGSNYEENDDSESSGDDAAESGSGEGSGEGSGDPIITPSKKVSTGTGKKDKTSPSPSVVDITVVSSTTTSMTTTTKKPKEIEEITTTISNCVDCEPEDKITEKPENNNDDEILNNDYEPENDKVEGSAVSGGKSKGGVNFTVGIIIGVVVGAVLAIVIIVFLVYRLRKKDEGSYCLDEQSSNAYMRADTNTALLGKDKEYFA